MHTPSAASCNDTPLTREALGQVVSLQSKNASLQSVSKAARTQSFIRESQSDMRAAQGACWDRYGGSHTQAHVGGIRSNSAQQASRDMGTDVKLSLSHLSIQSDAVGAHAAVWAGGSARCDVPGGNVLQTGRGVSPQHGCEEQGGPWLLEGHGQDSDWKEESPFVPPASAVHSEREISRAHGYHVRSGLLSRELQTETADWKKSILEEDARYRRLMKVQSRAHEKRRRPDDRTSQSPSLAQSREHHAELDARTHGHADAPSDLYAQTRSIDHLQVHRQQHGQPDGQTHIQRYTQAQSKARVRATEKDTPHTQIRRDSDVQGVHTHLQSERTREMGGAEMDDTEGQGSSVPGEMLQGLVVAMRESPDVEETRHVGMEKDFAERAVTYGDGGGRARDEIRDAARAWRDYDQGGEVSDAIKITAGGQNTFRTFQKMGQDLAVSSGSRRVVRRTKQQEDAKAAHRVEMKRVLDESRVGANWWR